MRFNAVRGIVRILLLLCLSILLSCKSAPVPPEVEIAETQEHDLWRTGAAIYAPQEYKDYKITLRSGKDHLIEEKSTFVWFRDYEKIQNEFRAILATGNNILGKVLEQRQTRLAAISRQVAYFQNRIDTLKRITSMMNEGRISRRQLTSAELLLNEVQRLAEKGQYPEAEKKLKIIPVYTASATEAMTPILNRFTDKNQIAKWRGWVNDTIEQSKAQGYSIFVSKIDRKLVLYKGGVPYRTYSIGLGKNGFHDKLYAGDLATPEGKYRIIKKQFRSRYYKALLINYPNDEDMRQFAYAKKKGLIPARAGIGGLIEIHGGGQGGMTYGCIGMEDHHIDELFRLVDVGTPVTIVGAIDYENVISSAIKDL